MCIHRAAVSVLAPGLSCITICFYFRMLTGVRTLGQLVPEEFSSKTRGSPRAGAGRGQLPHESASCRFPSLCQPEIKTCSCLLSSVGGTVW